MTVNTLQEMRWVNRAGIYFGTGNFYTYRVTKQWFGVGKTNFTWQPEVRDHDSTEWRLLSQESHIRHNRSLKDAKLHCWYHDQTELRQRGED